MACWLTSDARARLKEIETSRPPAHKWRSGCYGAALAWIVFVGPSPGGEEDDLSSMRGWSKTLHNEPFTDPLHWKMRNSIKPLLESLTGLPFEKSGKLYAFANFDFRQQPDARKVSEEAMRRGESRVVHVLRAARPRLVCAMNHSSWDQLMETLRRKQTRLSVEHMRVDIPIPTSDRRHHRMLDVAHLEAWPKDAPLFVRLPQHPSRIFVEEHARRIGETIHGILSTQVGR